jgi:hypothetical protein
MLVFGLKYLSWTEAMGMTFTDIEMCVREAAKWSEEAPRKR